MALAKLPRSISRPSVEHSSIPIEDLSNHLGITFKSEDAVSFGGFLTEYLQHIPKKGERVSYKNFYFQIQKASPRRVRQVFVFEKKNTK